MPRLDAEQQKALDYFKTHAEPGSVGGLLVEVVKEYAGEIDRLKEKNAELAQEVRSLRKDAEFMQERLEEYQR